MRPVDGATGEWERGEASMIRSRDIYAHNKYRVGELMDTRL